MYLYIMGRGRSGSTILDILLGNSSELESVGELCFGLSRGGDETCSCGARIPDCGFWRDVRSRLEAEGFAWEEACGLLDPGAGGLWRTWRAKPVDSTLQRRARILRALATAIAGITGKPHLLDSGKSPAQGLLLLRHLPEARVIHLVRDPRHFLQSYLWRVRTRSHLNPRLLDVARRSAPLFLLSLAASWTAVNLACDLMARAYPGRVLRVRFEDLCARPDGELERIGRAFGLDLDDLRGKAAGRQPLVVGHNIGGNRLRHAQEVRLDPAAGRAGPPLPRWLAAATLLLCGPLMRRYGYGLSGHASRPEGFKVAVSD